MSITVQSNEVNPTTPPATANPAATGEASNATANDATLANPTAGEAHTGEAEEHQEDGDSEVTETESTETEISPEKKEGTEEKKKKGGFQRRIDKLNARNSQTEQELEYWKRMAMKNNAGESTPNPSEQNSKTSTNAAVASDGKPNPDSYESHSEYVEALADWKVEQKLKARDADQAKERIKNDQAKIINTYTERMNKFAEKTPDFQEVTGDVDHIPLSAALQEIILSSENGPELAYHLAKEPAELERIAKLSPLACAREMGRFEAKLSQKSVSEKKTITTAPNPINPVKAGSGKVTKSISDPNISQAEFEKIRRQQMEAKKKNAG